MRDAPIARQVRELNLCFLLISIVCSFGVRDYVTHIRVNIVPQIFFLVVDDLKNALVDGVSKNTTMPGMPSSDCRGKLLSASSEGIFQAWTCPYPEGETPPIYQSYRQ